MVALEVIRGAREGASKPNPAGGRSPPASGRTGRTGGGVSRTVSAPSLRWTWAPEPSPGEDLPELAGLSAAQGNGRPLGVADDDPVVPRILGNDLGDGGEVHDEGAVAAEELLRVERDLELRQGAGHQVAVRARLREDELSLRLEPEDLLRREQVDPRAALAGDAVGRGPGTGPRSRAGKEGLGLRARLVGLLGGGGALRRGLRRAPAQRLCALADLAQEGIELLLGRDALAHLVSHACERRAESASVEGLEEVVDRVHFEGLDGIAFVRGREHDAREVLEPLEDLESVRLRHPDVQEDEIGPQGVDDPHGALAVSGLAHDLEVRVLGEEPLEAVPRRLLVVDHDRADLHDASGPVMGSPTWPRRTPSRPPSTAAAAASGA